MKHYALVQVRMVAVRSMHEKRGGERWKYVISGKTELMCPIMCPQVLLYSNVHSCRPYDYIDWNYNICIDCCRWHHVKLLPLPLNI